MIEKMLIAVMDFIKENHPNTASLIPDTISWNSLNNIRRVGYTSSKYSGGNWTVDIGHAAVPEILYEIRSEYKNGLIIWTGTIKADTINERSYLVNEAQ